MERLPVELLTIIFAELDPEDILNVAKVSRKWSRCCTEGTWKLHFRNRWGTSKFTPLKQPFTWQNEVIARHAALEGWKRSKIPAVSYCLPLQSIDQSAVNWPQNLILASSEKPGDGICISKLDNGSLHRGSRRASADPRHLAEPVNTCTTKFGILSSHYDGSLVLTAVGEMPVVVHQLHSGAVFELAWLSATSTVRSSSTITIVGSCGGRLMLFRNLKLEGEIALENDQDPGSVTTQGIYPFNRDEFMILTNKSIYRISSEYKYAHVLDIETATELHIVYPHLVIIGSHGIKRLDVETGQEANFTEKPITTVACDRHMIVGYTRSDQKLTAWNIEGHGEPIWSIPCPLTRESPHSDNCITAVALNAVVVVCGGFKGDLCVLDVLNGEKLPPKKMKKIAAQFDPNWIVPDGHIPDEGRRSNPQGTSRIHLGPTLEPQMAHVLKNSVTLYDATRDNKSAATRSVKPQRKRVPEVRYSREEVDLHDDYTIRGINRQNMTPDTLSREDEQLRTAVALSESHTPMLSEQDQMKLAIAESIAQQQSMSEEAQLKLALEMSMNETSSRGSATATTSSSAPACEVIEESAMEVDNDLQKAINASMMEQ